MKYLLIAAIAGLSSLAAHWVTDNNWIASGITFVSALVGAFFVYSVSDK